MELEHPDRSNGSWAKYDHHFPPLPSVFDASAEAHLTFNDSNGDDNHGACFQCPFCYVDIEVRTLSVHLEEDHCFDMKNAVCPVCAANFAQDLTAHLTLQHAHLLKRRKFYGFDSSTSGMATLGKDLEKLLCFLGIASGKNKQNIIDSAPDLIVSPSVPALKSCQEAGPVASAASPNISTTLRESNTTNRSPLPNEVEMIRRAVFYQGLMVSTIF